MAVLTSLVLLAFGTQLAWAQDYDFSAPIKCYFCEGPADNSSCADPIDTQFGTPESKECDQGMCVKMTKYEGGVYKMIRDCTEDMNFHLTMIDGVCRTERNGNGYLCMCGKSMCNGAGGIFWLNQDTPYLVLSWMTLASGFFFCLPHWIVPSGFLQSYLW